MAQLPERQLGPLSMQFAAAKQIGADQFLEPEYVSPPILGVGRGPSGLGFLRDGFRFFNQLVIAEPNLGLNFTFPRVPD